MFEEFEQFVQRYERVGKTKTAKTYRSLLNQFSKHLDSLNDLDAGEVRDYFDNKDYSKKSQNDLISCLKGFAKWYKNNQIDWEKDFQTAKKQEQRMNTIIDMIRPSVPERQQRKALRVSEIRKLLSGLSRRNGTYLLLSCYFGMRFDEWHNIEDVVWDRRVLKVMTSKTNVERVLPFSEKFEDLLRSFLDNGWNEFGYNAYHKALRPKSTALEGDVKVTPHSGRHSFESEMRRRVDEGIVKTLMGHSKDVPDIYDDPEFKHLENAMNGQHYLKDFEIPERLL